MSKERLSKLQKIILKTLYENNGCIDEPKSYQNRKLYAEVLNQLSDRYNEGPVNRRSISASMSRSIRNLLKKGYVDYTLYLYGFGFGSIKLTSKGYQVLAKEPVNTKDISKCCHVEIFPHVNNKEG